MEPGRRRERTHIRSAGDSTDFCWIKMQNFVENGFLQNFAEGMGDLQPWAEVGWGDPGGLIN